MKYIFTSFLAIFAITSSAAPAPDAGSFDTQLRQASLAIDKIAQEGLHAQYIAASSMDIQIRQASLAIDKIAQEGLK